ncbi:hypothetical protein Tco_0850608 [Tanacetum coccineum]
MLAMVWLITGAGFPMPYVANQERRTTGEIIPGLIFTELHGNYSEERSLGSRSSSSYNMEMEPDIENMTMSEYLEYKAVKERILWDDVRSKRSPTHYDEADFSYSRQNKSDTFYYPYSHDIPPQQIQSYLNII